MENHHHHHHTELQLLPSTAAASSSSVRPSSDSPFMIKHRSRPSLDLQLSMRQDHDHNSILNRDAECVQALKWQAAEQIRLTALEKDYAERVRELTRREMELAQSEFACARHVWETAREEVQRAERLKEIATRRIHDPSTTATCMEITCHSCRQRYNYREHKHFIPTEVLKIVKRQHAKEQGAILRNQNSY